MVIEKSSQLFIEGNKCGKEFKNYFSEIKGKQTYDFTVVHDVTRCTSFVTS